jgi:hypothetical protein
MKRWNLLVQVSATELMNLISLLNNLGFVAISIRYGANAGMLPMRGKIEVCEAPTERGRLTSSVSVEARLHQVAALVGATVVELPEER